MADWARENQTEFYKLYARLLPIQVDAAITHNFVMALPAALETTGEWQQKIAHPPLQS